MQWRRRRQIVIFSIMLMLPLLAQAVQCPSNSNFVEIGDSIQQVRQRCGPPKRTVELTPKAAIWDYDLVSFRNNRVGFSILFVGNAVYQMKTSQQVVKHYIKCPQGRIARGSTPAKVVAACGQPTAIRNVSKQWANRVGRVTHLIYQPRSYLPETTFIFKNGQLAEVR